MAKKKSAAGTAAIVLAFLGLLTLCPPARALDPTQRLSQYAHSSWRVQDGDLPGSPFEFAQPADGYLWVGYSAGVMRYDGVRFASIPMETGEGAPTVRSRATRDGSVLFGSADGLLRAKAGVVQRIAGVVAPAPAIATTRDGAWFTQYLANENRSELCQFNDKGVSCLDSSNGPDLSRIGCCALMAFEDRQGALWIGGDLGFLRWQDTSTTVYLPDALSSNGGAQGITAFTDDGSGGLWVGMLRAGRDGGLQRVRNGKMEPFVMGAFDSSTVAVFSLHLDSSGALWVGTVSNGLIRIFEDRVETFSMQDGLTSDEIVHLHEDHEGSLWVSTSRGIDQFRDVRVPTITMREGLGTDAINGLTTRRDGSVWLATGGGPDVIHANKASTIKDFPTENPTSLFEDHAGRLWIGGDQDLFLFDGGKYRRVANQRGESLGMVSGIAEGAPNHLWVTAAAGSQRTVFHLVDGKVEEELSFPHLPAVRRIAADRDGTVWLGLMNGELARYREGNAEKAVVTVAGKPVVPPTANDTFNRSNQVAVTEDGSVLAASGLGLVEVREGQPQLLSSRNGLPCDRVNSFVFDLQGDLWLGMGCGLVRIRKDDLQGWRAEPETRINARQFEAADGVLLQGLSSAFASGAARTPDGRLWFASYYGLQVVDPSRIDAAMPAPPVHVETLTADGKRFDVSGELSLPPLTRDITLDYAALSFRAPHRVAYSYRLEGHDERWHEAGNRRQAVYSNLGPGSYRFQVRACTHEGACNVDGESVVFSIASAFYQTTWFLILAALTMAALAWMAMNWRVRVLTQRVSGRLEERLSERERIARELHDTFLQSVQGLILKFQSVTDRLPAQAPERPLMDDALMRAEAVLREGRDRVTDMRATVEARDDFPSAIQLLATELTRDSDVEIKVTVNHAVRPLHAAIAEEAERIISEALANALRHAQASRIDVELFYEKRQFRVRVADDGCGFDVTSVVPGHWGLRGMRERAVRIRAQLQIRSEAGTGTVVELLIPTSVAFSSRRSASHWAGRLFDY